MTPCPVPLPRLQSDDFVSRDELAELERGGVVQVNGALARTGDGELAVLREAVRVLGNVSQETDPYGFTGLVDTLGSLLRRGFVVSGERIALGRSVYDVEQGYLIQVVSRGADRSGVNAAL